MVNVTVYSTNTCPWCTKAKRFLKDNNVNFNDVDVSTSEEAQNEMIEKSGQMGVPVIDVEGEVIVGFDVERLKMALGI